MLVTLCFWEWDRDIERQCECDMMSDIRIVRLQASPVIILWLQHLDWNIAIVTLWVCLQTSFWQFTFKLLCWIICYFLNRIYISLYTQGVLKVRKRVTLMGVTVTAIFGICWAPDIIALNLDVITSLSISEPAYAVIHTLVLYSSAVNPFVYALVNKTFRGKL